MKTINKNVKIFTDNIEDAALKQVEEISNNYPNSKIRIMVDCHYGKGCVIGTSMTIKDKLSPNLVGVDIGCNMFIVELDDKNIDFKKLDDFIHNNIPSGFNIYEEAIDEFDLSGLKCFDAIKMERIQRSIGTLGGGNHFIEVDIDEDGRYYLVIHSGSRNLGVQVCNYYQNLAYKKLNSHQPTNEYIIKALKSEGREKEINDTLKKAYRPFISKEKAYLVDEDIAPYLHDMKIVQHYAKLNTEWIAYRIVKGLDLKVSYTFHCVHNYISSRDNILRKGACSARKGEYVWIPLNMRDGALYCVGKGNVDWNCTAPHGAGRRMSRTGANKAITLKEFKESMKGVYTTSVNENTIDESPMAYKDSKEIESLIKDTVEIKKHVKPVYNFKASKE